MPQINKNYVFENINSVFPYLSQQALKKGADDIEYLLNQAYHDGFEDGRAKMFNLISEKEQRERNKLFRNMKEWSPTKKKVFKDE